MREGWAPIKLIFLLFLVLPIMFLLGLALPALGFGLAAASIGFAIFNAVDKKLKVNINIRDGAAVKKGDIVLTVEGSAQSILLAERLVLNCMQRMSGIATYTDHLSSLISGTSAKLLDTRKTTPGMRALEKYAVRMGGGTNHRMSLSDAALIKDNHIAAAGGVVAAFSLVREKYPSTDIEIEVDNLQQLRDVLPLNPGLVLLDNMSPAQCAEAVALVAGATKLEASGGITIENARAYAEAGVDYIAVGALTHSAPNFDIGLDMRVE